MSNVPTHDQIRADYWLVGDTAEHGPVLWNTMIMNDERIDELLAEGWQLLLRSSLDRPYIEHLADAALELVAWREEDASAEEASWGIWRPGLVRHVEVKLVGADVPPTGMSEVWTCARCARQIRVPGDGDGEYAAWELICDSALEDPEDWPVICPGCQTTEERIAWAAEFDDLEDA